MANTKLDRIERDIEKTRAKVLEYQKRLKDLEAQKIEEGYHVRLFCYRLCGRWR